MTLSYLVVADVDPASVRDDNPPEAVAPAFESEIRSWLDSLTSVFGLRAVRWSALTQKSVTARNCSTCCCSTVSSR